MNEKLKSTAEMLWDDEKTFLVALPILAKSGLNRTVAALRCPETQDQAYESEVTSLPERQDSTDVVFPVAV
ncbi:hypothetical protein HY379_00965 [Candidatus Saccharibacteria bacterium]|nr:hypothetical protein [Candidatus Saccharibacteria bacterium]